MKNKLNHIIYLILPIILIGVMGCEKEEYEFGDIITPSNLQVTADIVGQDADNPYGDGSGLVIFNVSAENAITYKFILDGTEEMAPSGELEYPFTTSGVNTYNVSVVAIGTAGTTTNTTISVEVFSECTASDEVIMMLTNNSSKTWRIKAEASGHFGVGPADGTDPVWWSAAPYDKDGKGAYDDQWILNIDGTFTHITNGNIYGQSGALDADFGISGQTPNGDNEYENYPVDDYSGEWSSCGLNGVETLTFNNLGFHGFYVGGNHVYQILEYSDNEMTMKTVGSDGNGWFVIFIAD